MAGPRAHSEHNEDDNDALQACMQMMGNRLQAASTRGIDATVQFHLLGDPGGDWYVIVRNKHWEVETGTLSQPDATITATMQDFVHLVNRDWEQVGWAFMQGRLIALGRTNLLWSLLA